MDFITLSLVPLRKKKGVRTDDKITVSVSDISAIKRSKRLCGTVVFLRFVGAIYVTESYEEIIAQLGTFFVIY